ncbi:hypothetical protein NP493_5256g00000 [Ridgeia piscesae]|uniref:Uncharacterized protein n=1 Tax=Ridgeia piscesae TaxID=27915 RepID=A0AAD9MRE2_RIDPI|nr:hypothetical protein NP493_5256g00000 [Ridgeia piscesae]
MAKYFIALLALAAVYAAEGLCNDRCRNSRHAHYYTSSLFYGRYYYKCNRGAAYYRSCEMNQSFYPAVGSRPFAADAEATSTADMADPFATGDAPGANATMTFIAIVVSTSATTAVAVAKQISREVSFVSISCCRYDGAWNGYDYDCCRNRRSNFFYPSLVKPVPYYYRCVGMRVTYGRCPSNQCVTVSGSCGMLKNLQIYCLENNFP